jgi:hypothetical protein
MGMLVHMKVLNLSMEFLMPLSAATSEPYCFFLLEPNLKEDDQNDSDILVKAVCLHLCDEVTEEVVENRAAEVC